jgi:hypothetical protein
MFKMLMKISFQSLLSEICTQLPDDIIQFSFKSTLRQEMIIALTILNIENIFSERNMILSIELIENSV